MRRVDEQVRRTTATPASASVVAQTQSLQYMWAGVSELARVLHEEARLAHELAGPLGQDAVDRVTTVVDLDLFVFLVRILLDGDQAILQDRVERGLDVVGFDQVVVVVLFLSALLDDDRSASRLDDVRVDDVDIDLDDSSSSPMTSSTIASSRSSRSGSASSSSSSQLVFGELGVFFLSELVFVCHQVLAKRSSGKGRAPGIICTNSKT